jgi:phosphatidylglycerol---prolipoprotein diacylglyceryl transferase
MYPELFELGPITVYSYGVLLAAAFLAGLKLSLVRARRFGIDPNRIMDLGIYVIISGLIGAKLLLFVTDFQYFSRNPGELFTLVRSGGVFYGGLLFALLVGLWYVRRHQMPAWTVADVVAPGIVLGHAIGRTGCLMAGCCFGKPTDLPWGLVFTNPLAASQVGTPLGIPLHPTQAYEALGLLVMLGGLLWLERRGGPYAGRTFWSYVLVYAALRLVVEFFRADERGFVMGVSTSQIISILLLPLAIFMLLHLARTRQVPEPAPARAARRRPR